MSEEGRDWILDEHNKRRSWVAMGMVRDWKNGTLPPAKNMYKLSYSDDLEYLARHSANFCSDKSSKWIGHDDIAMNIFNSYFLKTSHQNEEISLMNSVSDFWQENSQNGVPKDVRYSIDIHRRNVSRFTQMIWANVKEIGCDINMCNVTYYKVVCAYKPRGNILYEPIYEPGDPCQMNRDCMTYENSHCEKPTGLCVLHEPVNGITTKGRNFIINEHNNRRSRLARGVVFRPNKFGDRMPRGKNIYKLSHNKDLERSAQARANECTISPLPYMNIGENIYTTNQHLDEMTAINEAIKSFWQEVWRIGVPKHLNYTTEVAKKGVSRFTQMAWASTYHLGCGIQYCSKTPDIKTIVICHYYPPGNKLNEFIYEEGEWCKSNADCTTYSQSVCDAGINLCYRPKPEKYPIRECYNV